MNIQQYIDSGILESYVLGSASEEETQQIIRYKELYPEIHSALFELELDMERIAGQMAVTPPPGIWEKIEAGINEVAVQEYEPVKFRRNSNGQNYNNSKREQFIEFEARQSQILIHKNWKWVFAAVFVLGKIFLVCAIYFYLENRHAQEQIS